MRDAIDVDPGIVVADPIQDPPVAGPQSAQALQVVRQRCEGLMHHPVGLLGEPAHARQNSFT